MTEKLQSERPDWLDASMRAISALDALQRSREAKLIRADQVALAQSQARDTAEDAERVKKPGETDLAWRNRIARMDHANARALGPIVPPEAEQHGRYAEATVEHIDARTGIRTRAVTKQREVESALRGMRDKGQITEDQWAAAIELAEVGEVYRRAVSPGCASMEARVDRSRGLGGEELIERMGAVRMQMAYTRWRELLPMPRQLVLDMIHQDQHLFRIARGYNKGWPLARKWLIAALDRWPDIKARVWREVGDREVEAVYWRLGEGRLA